MATELPLLPLALVLLCHHLGRLRLFAGFEEVEEVREVEAHRVYLAHLDPHPAHYLQFHLDPHPAHYLQFHLDPHPALHLALPWYQLNQLISMLYNSV
jgi:hypothetical protein